MSSDDADIGGELLSLGHGLMVVIGIPIAIIIEVKDMFRDTYMDSRNENLIISRSILFYFGFRYYLYRTIL